MMTAGRHVCAPVAPQERHAAVIERPLGLWLEEAIYGPILALVAEFRGESGRQNEVRVPSALVAALRSGKVWYADGAFGGDFTAEISRELRIIGARLRPEKRLFFLAADALPYVLRGFVYGAQARSEAVHRQIIALTGQMEANIPQAPTGIALSDPLQKIVGDLVRQVDLKIEVTPAAPSRIAFSVGLEAGEPESAIDAAEAIAIQPTFSAAVRGQITRELTENLNLSIRGLAAERLPALRAKVEENLLQGGRIDRLSRIIEAEFGIAKRRVNFVARQETFLLTSKIYEARARQAGSQSYVWHTCRDERVRKDHAKLDGREFAWESPPVVDSATGKRAHPGEVFNCRCGARAVIRIAHRLSPTPIAA